MYYIVKFKWYIFLNIIIRYPSLVVYCFLTFENHGQSRVCQNERENGLIKYCPNASQIIKNIRPITLYFLQTRPKV